MKCKTCGKKLSLYKFLFGTKYEGAIGYCDDGCYLVKQEELEKEKQKLIDEIIRLKKLEIARRQKE